jgi:hypothetical protein
VNRKESHSHAGSHQTLNCSLDSLALAIPIEGYIYSPFEQIPNYAIATRFVFVPLLVLSGLWMWKGHALRKDQ